jgi:enamine deaminase RidA (YjgF/YER057c/UK114 family)
MTLDAFNPEALGPPSGWTNGLLGPRGGRTLFVAGQDASGPDGSVHTDDFVEQFGLVLGKILEVVREAGGRREDIGRLTIFVTDLDAYVASRKEVGITYREHMGRHFPAMALVEVRRLLDPRAKVEIEATAILPDAPSDI